jgi:spore photoproduct lyase
MSPKLEIPKNLVNQFDRVFIHRDCLSSNVAQRAIEFFRPDQIEIVDQKPLEEKNGKLSASEFSQSKRLLYLSNFQGAFFKRCPGAKPGLSCCNYFVLNLGSQCNMNCSYCYLQSLINSPVTSIYCNIEQALEELSAMAIDHPEKYYRVGTGELTDSLSLDLVTLYSRQLIEFFSLHPKWNLEFKTKSDCVDQFLDLGHKGQNTIVSWSINPQFIVESEEHGTASLYNRIEAARKCVEAGFSIAFHIDPMIWHSNWKANYSDLVDLITKTFRPEQVKWITVGALRFQPEQRHMMKERFGVQSLVTSAEVFKSQEGKYRYDSETRNSMFQFIVERFRQHNPLWRTTLCMEVKESWVATMATTPSQIEDLKELFVPLPQKLLSDSSRLPLQ